MSQEDGTTPTPVYLASIYPVVNFEAWQRELHGARRALARLGVTRQLGGEELEDDGAFEVGVFCGVDHAHPATVETIGDAVVTYETAVHRTVGQAPTSYRSG